MSDLNLTSIGRAIATEFMGASMFTEFVQERTDKEPYQAIFKLGMLADIPDGKVIITEHMFIPGQGQITVCGLDDEGYDEGFMSFYRHPQRGDTLTFTREPLHHEAVSLARADKRLFGHLTGAIARGIEFGLSLDMELQQEVLQNILGETRTMIRNAHRPVS